MNRTRMILIKQNLPDACLSGRQGSQVFADQIRGYPLNLCLSAFYIFVLLPFLIISCSSSLSSLYDSNFPLTTEVAKAKTSQLIVKVPRGWFAAEDNECKCIDLWLVKDDYSATLNFVALNVDSLTMKEIKVDELKSIIEFSKTFKKVKYGKTFSGFTKEENFEIDGKKFSAYQYLDDQKRNIRVAVFKSGNKFYELSAVPVKTNNLSELYKIQNSVLSSINF